MTTTTTTTAPATRTRPDRALRAVTLLSLLSGAALIVDTVTITVINHSFNPLDSILFLVGFAGLWLTAIGLAIHLSAGRRGRARAGTAIGVFLATTVSLGVVGGAFDQLGRHLFSRSNIGLHGEWSFFTIGICQLAIAAWAVRRAQRIERDAQTR